MNFITRESRQTRETATDVGTLWTMYRFDHRARCALFSRAGKWELRVLVDGLLTLTERCDRGGDTFLLAELWRRRLAEDGWRQVLPDGASRRAS